MTLAPTTALADVLALRGRTGWLSPPLRRVVPAGASGGALTVTLRPGSGGLGPLYEALSGDLTGRVVVVSAPHDAVAVWGEILGTAAAEAGAVAVAVDGAVRDVGTLTLPLWARSTRTVGPAGALDVAAVGAAVEIGDVTVRDGDLVVVDDDGMVALPSTDAAAVLADAGVYAAAEERIVTALRAGTPLRDAYLLKAEAVARLLS